MPVVLNWGEMSPKGDKDPAQGQHKKLTRKGKKKFKKIHFCEKKSY